MARAPKTNRVPRTRAGGKWTEAAFWGFLRSGIRQISTRWPPIADALMAARRPYTGPNARQKWEYECSECHCFSPQAVTKAGKRKTMVHVDHIHECGKLLSYRDVSGFVERLFCEAEGLRVLCHECHAARTAKSREDAA